MTNPRRAPDHIRQLLGALLEKVILQVDQEIREVIRRVGLGVIEAIHQVELEAATAVIRLADLVQEALAQVDHRAAQGVFRQVGQVALQGVIHQVRVPVVLEALDQAQEAVLQGEIRIN